MSRFRSRAWRTASEMEMDSCLSVLGGSGSTALHATRLVRKTVSETASPCHNNADRVLVVFIKSPLEVQRRSQYTSVSDVGCHGVSQGVFMKRWMLVVAVVLFGLAWSTQARAQTVSGVRAFGGGVAPLFNLVGPGNLYLDNQGTQGYMYTPGNNFQSYS